MPARKPAKRATAKRGAVKRTPRAVAAHVETVSAKVAAIEWLRKHKGEQAVKDVINAVLNDPRVTGLKGKTPEATVAAQLYVECGKKDGVIEKVGRGLVAYRGE